MIILFRKLNNNIFTIPVLLNSIEKIFPDFHFNFFSSVNDLLKINSDQNEIIYICYSFMTTEAEQIYDEVKEIRNELRNKKYLILGGGSHINGDNTNYFGFDYIFSGYSEESLSYFLKDMENNSSEFLNIKYSIKNKTVFPVNIPELSNSFPNSKFIKTLPPLEIMRGCNWKCNFCQTGIQSKNYIQMRNLESIEKYLICLKEKKFNRLNFISPNAFNFKLPEISFFDSVEKLLSLCREFNINDIEYGIFPSEVRPESITEENITLIKKYCRNKKVTIGAQSGNDRMLKLINRMHTIDDIINASTLIHKNILIPKIDFIIGFPEETKEDRKNLFNLIKMLSSSFNAHIHMHYFIPLSGTPFYYKNPTHIDSETEKILNKYTCDGIISNWWKKGIELSNRVVRFRNYMHNKTEE